MVERMGVAFAFESTGLASESAAAGLYTGRVALKPRDLESDSRAQVATDRGEVIVWFGWGWV